MKVTYFVGARGISIDRATNTVTVFGILEDFRSGVFPTVLPDLVLVGNFYRTEEEDNTANLDMVLKLGSDIILKTVATCDFADGLSCRLTIEFESIPLDNPGILSISLAYKRKALCKWEVNIHKREQEPRIRTAIETKNDDHKLTTIHVERHRKNKRKPPSK